MNDNVLQSLRCSPRLSFLEGPLGRTFVEKLLINLFSPILLDSTFQHDLLTPPPPPAILPFIQRVHVIFLLLESLHLPLSFNSVVIFPPLNGHLTFYFLSETSNYFNLYNLELSFPSQDS